jgi:hypothetical protein
MCEGCWREYGGHAIVNERTLDAARKVGLIYEFSDVGGDAHVVVDDWNLGDDNIRWNLADGMGIHEHTAEQRRIVRDALEALLALPMPERVSAMAIHDGFVRGEGGKEGA